MFAGAGADEAMLDAVRRAGAAGIRTGLISNSWGTRRYDRALLAELFDGVVISGDVGMRKPTPEIYELGARAIGPAAGRRACSSTTWRSTSSRRGQLGMATVHHVDAAQTIAELERLLGGRSAVSVTPGLRGGAGAGARWRPAVAVRAHCRPISCAPARPVSARWPRQRLNRIPTPQVPVRGRRLPARAESAALKPELAALRHAPRRGARRCTSARRGPPPSRS